MSLPIRWVFKVKGPYSDEHVLPTPFGKRGVKVSGSRVIDQVEEVNEEHTLRPGRCPWCGETLLGLTHSERLMVWFEHAPLCPVGRDTAGRRASGGAAWEVFVVPGRFK